MSSQSESGGLAMPAHRQVVLILDDEPIVTEGLSIGLEQNGRTVVTCNDLESAQIAVESLKPSHIVADVRLTGAFAFEGLDFITYAKRHSPGSRIILMTGDATEALQLEASQRGAVAFLQKPFGGRQLGALITLMSPALSVDEAPPVIMRIPVLDEILMGSDLYPVFQLIVELGTVWRPFGYESLARFRSASPLQNPSVLFEYANRKHRVHDLEFACITRTLEAAACVGRFGTLFVNIHPNVLGAGTALVDLLGQVQADVLHQLVLEITEQAPLVASSALFDTIERIRALGVRFAFDDFGVAYSHLSLIDRILPSFLKISQNFGTRFESDPTKIKIVTNFVSIANDFGCDLILEGIEDASTAEAAARLGIRLGQGYLFGRPTEASAFATTGQALGS